MTIIAQSIQLIGASSFRGHVRRHNNNVHNGKFHRRVLLHNQGIPSLPYIRNLRISLKLHLFIMLFTMNLMLDSAISIGYNT